MKPNDARNAAIPYSPGGCAYLLGSSVTVFFAAWLAVLGAAAGSPGHGWGLSYFGMLVFPVLAGFLTGISAWAVGKIPCRHLPGLVLAIILSLASSWGISFLIARYIIGF